MSGTLDVTRIVACPHCRRAVQVTNPQLIDTLVSLLPAWVAEHGSARMHNILANRSSQHKISFERALLDALRYQITPEHLIDEIRENGE